MTIEQVLNDMARAWNAGDGAGWAAHFTEDATFVDVVGRVLAGRAVIAREHQNIFDTIYRGSTLTIEQVGGQDLGGGLRLVHTATVLTVPAGPRAGETRAVQTKLFTDDQIMAFHNTIQIDGAAFVGHDKELAARKPQGWSGSGDGAGDAE
jgi:uncharacterized protein (TIGR02246 family)